MSGMYASSAVLNNQHNIASMCYFNYKNLAKKANLKNPIFGENITVNGEAIINKTTTTDLVVSNEATINNNTVTNLTVNDTDTISNIVATNTETNNLTVNTDANIDNLSVSIFSPSWYVSYKYAFLIFSTHV